MGITGFIDQDRYPDNTCDGVTTYGTHGNYSANITKTDNVNHPKHYISHPSGIECIEVTRHFNFNVGNAIKYCWRNGLKDEDAQVEDLEKAIFYLKDEIKRLRG